MCSVVNLSEWVGEKNQYSLKQESILVGCIPPAFLIPGESPYRDPPGERPPQERDPPGETPGERPPGGGPPGQRPPDRDLPEGTWDQEQRPLKGTWDQAARQEVISYRDPSVDRQTPVKTIPCPKLCFLAVMMHH